MRSVFMSSVLVRQPLKQLANRRLTQPSKFMSSHKLQYESPELVVTVKNKIRSIVIDRQAKKNAIDGAMYRSLTKAIRDSDSDDSTNIVVLTGKGEYYTAGNDMKDLEAIKTQEYKHAVHALIDCTKPVVVLVNGPAIGIGVTTLGLVDAVYASDKATFLTPFSKLSICAEGCSSYTFPRIMGNAKASELLYFSTKYNAQEAYTSGLVSAVFPHDKFEELAWARVNAMAELPLKSLVYSKELVRGSCREFLHKLNDEEADKVLECFMALFAQQK